MKTNRLLILLLFGFIACAPSTDAKNIKTVLNKVGYYQVEISTETRETPNGLRSDKLKRIAKFLVKVSYLPHEIKIEKIKQDSSYSSRSYILENDKIIFADWNTMDSYQNRMFMIDYTINTKPIEAKKEELENKEEWKIEEYNSNSVNQISFSTTNNGKPFNIETGGYILRRETGITLSYWTLINQPNHDPFKKKSLIEATKLSNAQWATELGKISPQASF